VLFYVTNSYFFRHIDNFNPLALKFRNEAFKCNKNECFLNFSIVVSLVKLKNTAKYSFLKQLEDVIGFPMYNRVQT